MAVISDLTDVQQQLIIDLNFNALIQRVNKLAFDYQPISDALVTEQNAVRSQFLAISHILDAVWNSGVVTADIILHPPG